jgi:flagellar hook-length control protein FliK
LAKETKGSELRAEALGDGDPGDPATGAKAEPPEPDPAAPALHSSDEGGMAAPWIPEVLKAMPNLKDDLLKQIQAGFPGTEQNARIILSPPDLGEIRIQFSMEDGFPSVTFTASENLVRHLLEQGIDQLKNLFGATAVKVDPLSTSTEQRPLQALPESAQEPAVPSIAGTEPARSEGGPDPSRTAPPAPATAEEISRRYEIRDLHRHLLDEIRLKIDPSRNEARIRLHPPELGDIKIHMAMEDNRLTVRMEVSEPLTRNLLERDLSVLKEALAGAGIQVGRFDIQAQRERTSRSGYEAAKGNDDPAEDGAGDGDGWTRGSSLISGSVHRLAVPAGVDYLVY